MAYFSKAPDGSTLAPLGLLGNTVLACCMKPRLPADGHRSAEAQPQCPVTPGPLPSLR